MLTNFQKQKLVTQFIRTKSGRAKLAAGMTPSLRSRRDYYSVVRKAFYVEDLPDGALPIFDVDPEVGAFFAGEDADSIISRPDLKRVTFDLFEIYSNPNEKLVELKNRRFDLVDRLKVKGSSEVMLKEDRLGLSLIKVSGDLNPAKPAALVGPLTPQWVGLNFAAIEAEDLPVARVFVNGRDYAEVRNFGRDYFDFETQRVLLNSGVMGDLWGAKVIRTRAVDFKTLFFTTEPEFLGRISERIPLTVLPDEDTRNRRIGFSIFEYISMGTHNPLGANIGDRV